MSKLLNPLSLTVLLCMALSFSCSDSLQTPSQTQNMISFKNFDEFFSTQAILDTVSAKEKLIEWSDSKSFRSWLSQDDTSEYAFSFKTLFNTDREVQVGNKIVWFDSGVLYGLPIDNPNFKSEFKRNPSKDFQIGKYTISTYTKSTEPGGRVASVPLQFNQLDARNQFVFTQQTYIDQCGGTVPRNANGGRKYVHEIYDHTVDVNPGPVHISTLKLRIKLEYRSNGSWKPAGEHRDIAVDINGYALQWPGSTNFVYFNFKTYWLCSNNQEITLTTSTGPPSTSEWDVFMTGTITQHVCGDVPANQWINDGRNNTDPYRDAGALW